MASAVVKVRMTAEQLARLDALAAAAGTTRSAVLRRALGDDSAPAEVDSSTSGVEPAPLSREWALRKLQERAAGGSTLAAIALARELRLEPLRELRPVPTNLYELSPDEWRRMTRR
jgi:hypothetical protein